MEGACDALPDVVDRVHQETGCVHEGPVVREPLAQLILSLEHAPSQHELHGVSAEWTEGSRAPAHGLQKRSMQLWAR